MVNILAVSLVRPAVGDRIATRLVSLGAPGFLFILRIVCPLLDRTLFGPWLELTFLRHYFVPSVGVRW